MKKYIVFITLIFAISIISCSPRKKHTKTPKVIKKNYPAILWQKTQETPFVIAGESKRRIFILNQDEHGNFNEITAIDKNTGRKKWSEKVEIAIKNSSLPWTYGVAFKGISIAIMTKNNDIIAFDKYKGSKLWDKPVKGNGIYVLGENFITFWKNNIILIDPTNGKTIQFDMKRTINDLVVTPKGYLLVLTGEILNLVDLENEKINKIWTKHLDLDGGFIPFSFTSTENTVLSYQITSSEEHLVFVKSLNLTTLKNNWNLKLRGTAKGYKSFLKYADAEIAKIILTPTISGEYHWLDIDFKTGKTINEHLSFKYPNSNCLFASKTVYCTSEKGVTAYDKNMKKLWFRETIYPVNEGKHKVINNNIVLAAGTRIKVFSPLGDTVFVYDIKSKSLKEPRAGEILGSFQGKLIFTVIDYENKNKAEIWAVDGKTKQRVWRVAVGTIADVSNHTLYNPSTASVYTITSKFITKIDLNTGKVKKRRHKQKLTPKAKLKINSTQDFIYAVYPKQTIIYNPKNLTQLHSFKLNKKIKNKDKAKKTPKFITLKMKFLGINNSIILFSIENSKKVQALDIKKGKILWETELPINFNFTVKTEVIDKYAFINSYDSNFIIDISNGKVVHKLPKVVKYWRSDNNIIFVTAQTLIPKSSARLIAFPYEKSENSVKALWSKKFDKIPAWISVGPEYVFIPSDDKKCLEIISDSDGSNILKFCKGMWNNPPLSYKEKYYVATGDLNNKIPLSQQGLLKFNLNGKWKQIIKPGKYKNPKYTKAQYHKIRRGIIYLATNGNTLQAIAIDEP